MRSPALSSKPNITSPDVDHVIIFFWSSKDDTSENKWNWFWHERYWWLPWKGTAQEKGLINYLGSQYCAAIGPSSTVNLVCINLGIANCGFQLWPGIEILMVSLTSRRIYIKNTKSWWMVLVCWQGKSAMILSPSWSHALLNITIISPRRT